MIPTAGRIDCKTNIGAEVAAWEDHFCTDTTKSIAIT
jgi:hypothetical protein